MIVFRGPLMACIQFLSLHVSTVRIIPSVPSSDDFTVYLDEHGYMLTVS